MHRRSPHIRMAQADAELGAKVSAVNPDVDLGVYADKIKVCMCVFVYV